MRWGLPSRSATTGSRDLGWPAVRVLVLVLVGGVLLAGALVVPVGALGRAAAALPGAGTAVAERNPAATVLLDADGRPFAHLYEQNRRPVPAARIAPVMKQAIVAIEDRRFFEHPGVDPIGILRALVSNTARGAPLSGQGASTITMQYVKNHRLAVADTEAEKASAVADTLGRKLTDALVALSLERTRSKQQILADYLNTVYFGHGAYGVAAAARVYFDNVPSALTLPQAALLAAIVHAPTTIDPITAPDATTARRGLVLDAMADTGAITDRQAAAAAASDLGVVTPLAGAQR